MFQPLRKYFQELEEPTLTYQPSPNQGQCTLRQIHPLKKSSLRFALYILLSICTCGLFALVVYWYPQLQRVLIYSSSQIDGATHFFILNYDGQYTIVERIDEEYHPNQSESYPVIGFVNRYMKYVIINGVIRAVDFEYRKRISNIFNSPIQGYTNTIAQKLRLSHGLGTMIIQRPSLLVLFCRQVFRPLYLFIIFSIILWSCENYQYYASVIFVTSAISIAINLYQVRQLNEKIFHMAYYDIPVNVLRENGVLQISSVDVVPGDVVFLKDPIKLPFEGIILEGSALINQCALTGESVPIVKKADLFEKYKNPNIEIDKSSYVYEGTTIIQVNTKGKMNKFQAFRQAYGIPVCVIRTNFVTLKGQLIRIISFAREQENEFQRQSSKFLIFLFCLSVISYSVLIIRLHEIVSVDELILRFLDLITITVPPGLPVSMTFGIIFAVEKLKDKQIFCISPNKIISGGRVKHACFDKTGTLTEDFMDFYGLVPCSQKKMYPFIASVEAKQGFQKPKIQDILAKNPWIGPALGNMASNHSIIQIESTLQLVGDPMQIKLFQFGEFDLDFSHHSPNVVFSFSSKRNHQGVIFRRFQFDSQVQRMSVIASDSMDQNGYHCYCKGSPEVMFQIMNKNSIPDSYHQTLKEYASRGFRVLAIASKKIKKDPKDVQRIDAESNLNFDGFQVFQNKLKKETYDAIQDLKEAQISCVMITGDNPLTGSNIAYKCEIAHLSKKMMICDYKNGSFFSEEFFYNEIESNRQKRKEYIQKRKHQEEYEQESESSLDDIEMIEIKRTIKVESSHNAAENLQTTMKVATEQQGLQFMKSMNTKAEKENYQFCLTGSAFNQLMGNHTEDLDEARKRFIQNATVYARTKPIEKARIITMYQKLGHVVAMCGDGANDCEALKLADVGLSLSQAQASISAPFTSKVINISAVVELIKECRAGLATNFSLFNIMAIYSLIQYTSVIITQFLYSFPSDFMQLYWDFAGNFLFFLTFGYTGTVSRLSRHLPNNSLFCLTNILQLVYMFALQVVGQICMLFILSGEYGADINYSNVGGQLINQQKYIENDQFMVDTPETNIIFFFTNFMYIFSFVSFSVSKPWRKQFWTNLPFMIVFFIVFTFSVLLTVVPGMRLSIFQISWMNSQRLNGLVLGMALLFSVFMYYCQKFALEPLTAWLKEKYPDKKWL